MKSRWIYAAAMIGVLVVCIGLGQIDVDVRAARVHQHRAEEWAPATDPAPGATHLPIVRIETGGQTIPGEVRVIGGEDQVIVGREPTIIVDFSLIDGGQGNNTLRDDAAVSTQAAIRYRGNSSRYFDKKSYAVHLLDEDGGEDKQALAGMSAHDEWVLYGPYLDRTLIRNYLCYNIAGEIMEYAPNVRFCRLYVDGGYEGLYLLTEAVSRGEGRINIQKPEGSSGVTSYIVRWDRVGKGDHELNNYTFYTYANGSSALDIRYPGQTLLTPRQEDYVEQNISAVEKMLYSTDLVDPVDGFESELDLDSFAEYFVINEFFRNVDAGFYSTYLYRDVRGKLQLCVWDFNNACDNYIENSLREEGFSLIDAPWFGRLIMDERFVDAVVEKYRALRQGVLSTDYLLNYVAETVAFLGDEVDLNYARWGAVFSPDTYTGDVHSNFLQPMSRNYESYEEALEQLTTFLAERGAWLDAHIESLYQYCHPSRTANELVG